MGKLFLFLCAFIFPWIIFAKEIVISSSCGPTLLMRLTPTIGFPWVQHTGVNSNDCVPINSTCWRELQRLVSYAFNILAWTPTIGFPWIQHTGVNSNDWVPMNSTCWCEAYRLFEVFLENTFHLFVAPDALIGAIHFIQLLEFSN